MKKITIYYEKGFYGRLRAVKIFADSLQVDLLKPGEEKTFEVDSHAIKCFTYRL